MFDFQIILEWTNLITIDGSESNLFPSLSFGMLIMFWKETRFLIWDVPKRNSGLLIWDGRSTIFGILWENMCITIKSLKKSHIVYFNCWYLNHSSIFFLAGNLFGCFKNPYELHLIFSLYVVLDFSVGGYVLAQEQ